MLSPDEELVSRRSRLEELHRYCTNKYGEDKFCFDCGLMIFTGMPQARFEGLSLDEMAQWMRIKIEPLAVGSIASVV